MQRLRGQQGISIVDLIVGVGILAIVVLATVSLVYNQTTQIRTIMQNRDASELHKTLVQAMSNSDSCTCLLNPSRNVIYDSNLHFDSTLPTPGRMDVHELFSECDGQKHPMNSIAVTGQKLPGSDSELKVADIALDNIKCVKGPQNCTGLLTVKWETGSKLAVHPVAILEQFKIDNKKPSKAFVTECTGIVQSNASIGDANSLSNWPLAVSCSCTGADKIFHLSSSFKNGQQSAIRAASGMTYVSGTDQAAAVYYDRSGNYVLGPGTACRFTDDKPEGAPSCPAQLHLDGRVLEY